VNVLVVVEYRVARVIRVLSDLINALVGKLYEHTEDVAVCRARVEIPELTEGLKGDCLQLRVFLLNMWVLGR